VAALKVTEVIKDGMRSFIPNSVRQYFPSSPWFNSACFRALKAKDSAYRRYSRNPSTASHANYILTRNRCKSTLKTAKHNFIRRKCNNLLHNGTDKSFWSLFNNISNNFCKSSFPPIIGQDGSVASSPESKATLFASLFSQNSTLHPNIPNPDPEPLVDPMPPLHIYYERVRDALLALDIKKAYGSDGIPPLILRECAFSLANPLVRLFRLCIVSGTFPSCWKHSLVFPVPKKGDRSCPSNYRPIALTCVQCKIFESILNKHIVTHLTSKSLLSDRQYGFRSGRSTGDIMSLLTNRWASALRDRREVGV
jgi:hypothetical protein